MELMPPQATAEAVPAATRLLAREPQLAPLVERVMATGQTVRELAAATFAQPLEPPWMAPPSLAQARELLAQAKKEMRPEFLRQLLALLVQARAESFRLAPTRTTTSPVARALLVQAMNAFRTAWEELAAALSPTEKAQAPHELLRLFLAAHADPALPWGEVRLAGNELVGVPAASWPWGERCFLTGRSFQHDGTGIPRWRSLELMGDVLSEEGWEAWHAVQQAWRQLGERDGKAAEDLAAGLPALAARFCREEASVTFVSLGLAAFPSLAVALHNALSRFSERSAFGLVAEDRWLSYHELQEHVFLLAHALRTVGLAPGETLGLAFAEPGWSSYLLDFAALWAGAVTVGIGPHLPPRGAVELLRACGVRMVVGDAQGLARLSGFGGQLFSLTQGADFAPLPVPRTVPAAPLPCGLCPDTPILWDDGPSWSYASKHGIAADHDELYTLVLTSGSSGDPKPVGVSRARFRRMVAQPTWLWPLVVASFQPYELLADRTRVWNTLLSGGRVGFCRRGAELWRDLEQLAPTYLEGPPALFQSLLAPYRALLQQGAGAGELAALRLQVRRRLGGRVAAVALGGAMVEPDVPQLLSELLQVPVKEAYGTTEVGRIAEAGQLLPGVEVKLVDRPELGYTHRDRPHPRGELAVKLPPEELERVRRLAPTRFTDDGFFLTGDLVELGPERHLRVLGRTGNLLKLAEGKFFAPEAMEAALLTHGGVRHAVVLTNPHGPGVVLVVVPTGKPDDPSALAARLATRMREQFPDGPPIAGVVVDDTSTAWSPESGLLTPSFKLNRAALAAHYAEAVASALQPRAAPPKGGEDGTVFQLLGRLRRTSSEPLDPHLPLGQQGLDSLAAVELLLWAEARGTPLATEQLAALTPTELAQRLESPEPTGRREPAGHAPAPTRGPEPGLLLLRTPLARRIPAFSPDGMVLLTGATGFLGVHLLAELARSPGCPGIVALVRARDHVQAAARLREQARRCQVEIPDPTPGGGEGETLWALAANLSEPGLGLEARLYERVAERTAAIVHAAASVRHAAPLTDMLADNVEPTRNLLHLASQARLKAFHLVSTLDVTRLAGGPRSEGEEAPLPETPPPGVEDGYVLSKWVSERMVELVARHCGGAMPVLVSRPGLVSWASRTGVASPSAWFTRLLLSCLELRLVPLLEPAGWPAQPVETETSVRGLEPLPVDFLAQLLGQLTEGLVGAAAAGKPSFYRLNLVNTNPGSTGLVTWPQLFWSLQAAWLAETQESPLACVAWRDFRDLCLARNAPFAPLCHTFRELPALPRQRAQQLAAFLRDRQPPACSWELFRPFVRWALHTI